VAVAELIEEGVRSCRISASTEKKGFEGKMKQVDHVEGGHKGKKNQFHPKLPTLISTLYFPPKNLSP
jgi:hypothetical protein